ncbi:hypothetical protein GQF61_06750 [Sphingobacterium sp. DK4209]|uniref:GDYXXLXY domain-containing protein n=1 Tax=Sphingobacterium zhuxiongii TaxID=2662364 RepID=A0A5Q0QCW6_9SPHI|nr:MULTISPECIES: GDYXXLXY domain-containing protein [unclassified Sphingobacterium]MVZ65550.1 hypothetical protein [Sphingobacterium sp. DK4209]QGA27675.1 hypothetical protein GFH32_15720 [Sphingobacterium sp. dk4302]
MKKISIALILINLLILLIYFNYSVVKKENMLNDGQLILLELAPVDPRSLMQGDYMQLNYRLTEEPDLSKLPRRGYCVLQIDKQHVAKTARLQANKTPLNPGEILIAYTRPDEWRLNIGAESFFFQEGTGERYEQAKYGALKVDQDGNSLLVGLYDQHKKQIK